MGGWGGGSATTVARRRRASYKITTLNSNLASCPLEEDFWTYELALPETGDRDKTSVPKLGLTVCARAMSSLSRRSFTDGQATSIHKDSRQVGTPGLEFSMLAWQRREGRTPRAAATPAKVLTSVLRFTNVSFCHSEVRVAHSISTLRVQR